MIILLYIHSAPSLSCSRTFFFKHFLHIVFLTNLYRFLFREGFTISLLIHGIIANYYSSKYKPKIFHWSWKTLLMQLPSPPNVSTGHFCCKAVVVCIQTHSKMIHSRFEHTHYNTDAIIGPQAQIILPPSDIVKHFPSLCSICSFHSNWRWEKNINQSNTAQKTSPLA